MRETIKTIHTAGNIEGLTAAFTKYTQSPSPAKTLEGILMVMESMIDEEKRGNSLLTFGSNGAATSLTKLAQRMKNASDHAAEPGTTAVNILSAAKKRLEKIGTYLSSAINAPVTLGEALLLTSMIVNYVQNFGIEVKGSASSFTYSVGDKEKKKPGGRTACW